MRAHLGRRAVDEAAAEHAIATLVELGYLDDARFARRFAEDRRTLDGWGAERIERRLRELGIDRIEAAEAARAAGPEEELDAAVELLSRRFPPPLRGERDLNRALGLLVRRGYELELAHDAIRRYAA